MPEAKGYVAQCRICCKNSPIREDQYEANKVAYEIGWIKIRIGRESIKPFISIPLVYVCSFCAGLITEQMLKDGYVSDKESKYKLDVNTGKLVE